MPFSTSPYRHSAATIVLLIILISAQSPAQYIPGQTYFGRNQYVEYFCGNSPLVITAPHAGALLPAEIADRTCGSTQDDLYTNEMVRAVRDSFYVLTGKYPHVIINRLKRIKLDANREQAEATCGDTVALISWKEYHQFIDSAKAHVIREYGKGFLDDFHGHGHDIQRIEVGYLLSSDDLSKSDSSLDSSVYVNQTGLRHLAGIVPLKFSELIRGPKSLGSFFEDNGYPAVPSYSQPNPGASPYFDGGYTVSRHGSLNGGTIDAVLTEFNYTGIRNTDANRRAFAHAYARVLNRFIQVHYFAAKDTVVVPDTVISGGNGLWSSPSTWAGGIVPSSMRDVLIKAGDTIIIDINTAQCRNVSFGSNSSKFAMTATGILNVYGNFTLFSASHNAFSSWETGSKIRFTGFSSQFLNGWSTTGFSTSFEEMIVDKTIGFKVATPGTNMKFCVGRSLDIINGTFELAGYDDLEGRSIDGIASAPVINIGAGGTFNMVGGGNPTGSYIRKGSNSGPDDKKIGKMTTAGAVYFATSDSTVKVNLGGLDIENGGIVYFSTSRGTQTKAFNPGTITIKSGGLFRNSLSTNIWFANPLTPTVLVMNSGGEYYHTAGTTYLPQSFTLNPGCTFRYYSTSTTALPSGISTYENLIIAGPNSRSIGVNTTVNGALTLSCDSVFNTGTTTLTLGPSASVSGEQDGRYIIGTVQTTRSVGTSANNFGGIGISLAAGNDNVGNVTVSRKTGASAITTVNGRQSIARKWTITSDNPPSQGRDLTLSWVSSDDNGRGFSASNNALVYRSSGGNWLAVGTGAEVSSLTPRSITVRTTAFSDWTVGAQNAPLSDVSVVKDMMPDHFSLENNFPNPFNPSTTFRYALPLTAHVKLTIHDVLGREIETLVNEEQSAGWKEVQWNPAQVSSGIYFYRLQTESFVSTRKLILLR